MENVPTQACEAEKDANERSPIAKESDRVEKAVAGLHDAIERLETRLRPITLATPQPDPEPRTTCAKSEICGVMESWADKIGTLHGQVNRMCEEMEL